MSYELLITHEAELQFEDALSYMLYKLKNRQAASHFVDEIEKIYDRLEENPFQFPESRDVYLHRMGFRQATLSQMRYIVIYRIEEDRIYIEGIFHDLENYSRRLHVEEEE